MEADLLELLLFASRQRSPETSPVQLAEYTVFEPVEQAGVPVVGAVPTPPEATKVAHSLALPEISPIFAWASAELRAFR